MKHFSSFLLLLFGLISTAASQQNIVILKLSSDINSGSYRMVTKALSSAKENNAKLMIINLDTYGGLLIDADSISKALINSTIPIYAYVNTNAASAGALIALSADKIFMHPNAKMGSASVVDQDGNILPDKYQSYMRASMRAAATANGYDTTIVNGIETIKLRRDPKIAEGMVDEKIVIEGLVSNEQIVALTSKEAIEVGYCEGIYSSLNELIKNENLDQFHQIVVKKTTLDKLIGFLSNPFLRSALIMFIFWGLLLELRTAGIGIYLAIAVLASILYFAPLYLDGLAENWEILIFVIGLILIGLEIFVVPGFGLTGISGIILLITGLVLSLISNVSFNFEFTRSSEVNSALLVVLFSIIGSIAGLFIFGGGIMNSPFFKRFISSYTLRGAKASINPSYQSTTDYTGQQGTAQTDLRPMGKILINKELIDAKSQIGYIEQGTEICILYREFGYWVVTTK